MLRRHAILASTAFAFARTAFALPPAVLAFPRDHGAHPDYRTEWWYITGHATAGSREFGFQVTFFRSRVDETQAMTSKFAAKQLVFGHAAVTDLEGRKLHHDQRIAREGFGVATAAQGDARLKLRDWSLERGADGTWHANIPAAGFALDLRFAATQPVLLQGSQGLSRKGPEEAQASYYYSQPQLAASGRIALNGRTFDATGRAWLDHEWSESLLHPEAVGWDWIGMNLDDGSALTAFRLRRRDGTALWDGGSFRTAEGKVSIAPSGSTRFVPRRRWTSPASRATYPVEWLLTTASGVYTVKARLDDQELDSRASTGAIYWEGLADLYARDGRRIGRGYLEMTGYAGALKL
ncbi:lipocalin-like domain-containing protein [Ramlibacter sp.]|uniref:lipocalin-like domain-containing protein n=1 Tax=Ramlibacter sp. TaxID=1917967 RepID=UPI003D0C34CD